MTINHLLHERRARQAWPILVARASRGLPPLTYGQLCQRLGLHWRSASWFLGVIQSHCRRAGLPPLQALAVNARTGLPGAGYHGSGRSRAAHARALKRVWRKQWTKRAPF